MIICSCNGITDHDVRRCAGSVDCRLTVSAVYRSLGHAACCGTCAQTIRSILDETAVHARTARECGICPVRQQLDAAKTRAARSEALMVFA